jgi:hypothetical protein
LAENRIALFLRLTSAILGVTITLANILTQISKQGTTLTTPQSAQAVHQQDTPIYKSRE